MRKNCLPLGFCFLCCAKIAVFANARKKSKVSSPALCWRRHFLWCFVAESPLRLFQFVLFVGENYRGFECLRFFGRHHGV